MRNSKRRAPCQAFSTALSIEVCESRQLLSAAAIETIAFGGISVDSVSVALVYDEDAFLSGDRSQPFIAAIARASDYRGDYIFVSGRSSNFGAPDAGGIEVWVDDITSGEKGVVRTYFHQFGLERSWLKEGHEYRIFARSGPLGSWTQPSVFGFSSQARLLPLRDATSFRDAGFQVVLPLAARAGLSGGFPFVSFIPNLQSVVDYTVEISNRDTGDVVHTLTLSSENSDLRTPFASLLPDTPTAPGRYSARIRSRVFTADQKYVDGLLSTGTTVQTEWSAPVIFNIYVAPLQVTGGSGSTADATPTISWNPVSNAQSYEVWIGPPGSNQPTYRGSGFRGRSHEVATALPNGDYNFWVRAHLVGGGFSAWGTASNLSIGVPVTLLQTAARTLSWNAATGANRYEIWIDYLGGTSHAGAQIVHETALMRTSYSLPARLPAGGYRAWVRAIRFEGRDVYRSTWSRSLTIEVVDAADDQAEALTVLGTNLNQPGLASIAKAESQHPDPATSPDAVDQNFVEADQSRDEVYGPITLVHSVSPANIHEASLIDQLAAGDLLWLSGDQDGRDAV